MKNPFSQVRLFATETFIELRKASWPTKKELRDYTIMVLVAMVLLGGYIAAVDFSLFNLVSYVTELIKS